MQHRVNRWLSPDLIPDPEAVQLGRVTFRPFEDPATEPADFGAAPPGEYTYGSRGRRRAWQRIAAMALLAGSAAFSYVAWSQGHASRLVAWGSEALAAQRSADPGAETLQIPSDDERLQALRQDQVLLLRQENQLLRERVAALRSAVLSSDTP